MALAPIAYELYDRGIRYDPKEPEWPDRDRFVLSAGHASMLLYSVLHLAGYDLPMDELKPFRQWDSRTPGHPEWHHTAGVETTTGPLGQGIGNAVGMAIAEQMLAARFNRAGHEVVNHRTFAICSDGDLMEGVSGEASSIAGHLGLASSPVYDDNHITIEGKTELAFSEDVRQRYEAYGWYVQRFDDTTIDTVREALAAADAETDRPSFIVARTHIANGAPHAHDTAKAHGAPLGEEEIRLTKKTSAGIPTALLRAGRRVRPLDKRRAARPRTHGRRASRRIAKHTASSRQLERVLAEKTPRWLSAAPERRPGKRRRERPRTRHPGPRRPCPCSSAARRISRRPRRRSSTVPTASRADTFAGRNFHFGIREHGMGAI